MDNGPELVAWAARNWCCLARTRRIYIEPGSPWETPFVESFDGRACEELLHYSGREQPSGKGTTTLAPPTGAADEQSRETPACSGRAFRRKRPGGKMEGRRTQDTLEKLLLPLLNEDRGYSP